MFQAHLTIPRIVRLDLPKGQSSFLWGPRKTGKSTYLRAVFPESVVYDFLKSELVFELSKRPSLLREQLLVRSAAEVGRPIILDEVQKVPSILDEVHWLIENRGMQFVMCGSSARKLMRGQANLLGGRAWRCEMFPLVSSELAGRLNLLQALQRGLVPSHYLSTNYRKAIDAYVVDYLKEEVFAEGLTRNVPAFSRFFEAMGYSHGELTNYANIARDCGVDSKTVKEYYQILCDTLLGRWILPYKKRQERQVIGKAPKFYLFDVGIAGAISKRALAEEKGEQFGRAFEHFILMELVAHASYSELRYDIHFWRTKSGLEVDFILGPADVAIEVKGHHRVDDRDLKSLRAFMEEHAPRSAIVVCNESSERIVAGIRIMPWRVFLGALWSGDIVR